MTSYVILLAFLLVSASAYELRGHKRYPHQHYSNQNGYGINSPVYPLNYYPSNIVNQKQGYQIPFEAQQEYSSPNYEKMYNPFYSYYVRQGLQNYYPGQFQDNQDSYYTQQALNELIKAISAQQQDQEYYNQQNQDIQRPYYPGQYQIQERYFSGQNEADQKQYYRGQNQVNEEQYYPSQNQNNQDQYYFDQIQGRNYFGQNQINQEQYYRSQNVPAIYNEVKFPQYQQQLDEIANIEKYFLRILNQQDSDLNNENVKQNEQYQFQKKNIYSEDNQNKQQSRQGRHHHKNQSNDEENQKRNFDN